MAGETWDLQKRLAKLGFEMLSREKLDALQGHSKDSYILGWAGGLSGDGTSLFAITQVPFVDKAVLTGNAKSIRKAMKNSFIKLPEVAKAYFVQQTAMIRGGQLHTLWETVDKHGRHSKLRVAALQSAATPPAVPLKSKTSDRPAVKTVLAATPRSSPAAPAAPAMSLLDTRALDTTSTDGTARVHQDMSLEARLTLVGKPCYKIDRLVKLSESRRAEYLVGWCTGTFDAAGQTLFALKKAPGYANLSPAQKKQQPFKVWSDRQWSHLTETEQRCYGTATGKLHKSGVAGFTEIIGLVLGKQTAFNSGVDPSTKFPVPEVRHERFAKLPLEQMTTIPTMAQFSRVNNCFVGNGHDLFDFHVFPSVCASFDALGGDVGTRNIADAIWHQLSIPEKLTWTAASTQLESQLKDGKASAVFKLLPYAPPLGIVDYQAMAQEQLDRFLREAAKQEQESKMSQVVPPQISSSREAPIQTRAIDAERIGEKFKARAGRLDIAFKGLALAPSSDVTPQDGPATNVLDTLVPRIRRTNRTAALLGQVLSALSERLGSHKASRMLVGRTGDSFRIDYDTGSRDTSGIASRLQELAFGAHDEQIIEQLLLPFAQWNQSRDFPGIDLGVEVGEAGLKAYESRWLHESWKLLHKKIVPVTSRNAKDTLSDVVSAIRKKCQETARQSAALHGDDEDGFVNPIVDYFHAKLVTCFDHASRASKYYEDQIERCLYQFDSAIKGAMPEP